MSPRSLLLAVSWMAVTACTTSEPRDLDEPAEPSLELALAARHSAAIALPPLSQTSVGRCGVELGPRPPETHQLVLGALVARNGTGWETTDRSFDALRGTLRYLQRTGGGTSDRSVPANDDDARRIALAFFAENYDLFGLSAADLADVAVSVTGDDNEPTGAIVGRTVELARNDVPGDRAFWGDHAWRAQLTFERRGPLRFVNIQADQLLPAVALCDRPALAADAAAVRAAVVGYHLSFSSIDGTLIDVGEVAEGDIASSTLITHRAWSDDRDRVVLQRAYELVVALVGGWSFIVDAETGERLAVYQQFVT